VTARDYRNRRIGDFLKELNLTEGRGTGFPKIYQSMERNGSPAPEFYTDKDLLLFLVTLYVHPEFIHRPPVSIEINDQDTVVKNENTVGETVGETEKTVGEIGQTTENKIIALIKNNSKIKREELAEKIGISTRGIEYQLSQLKRKGKLKRMGSTKGGYWEVSE
jgi:ATP-dependent DNA helicase RecG